MQTKHSLDIPAFHGACPSPCPWRKSMYMPLVRVRVCVLVHVRVYKSRNAGLSSIRSVRYRNEKFNDAGTGLVLDQAFFRSGIGLKL
jgi:hypothetical protein